MAQVMQGFEQTATALLVIDMQRDFVEPSGALCVAGAAATVPQLARLLSWFREPGHGAVFHVVRAYRADGLDVELARRPAFWRRPAVVAGTRGAEIVPELCPVAGERVIVKPRYSAFFRTELELCLRALGVRRVVVSGTQYPNCIRATVTDALSLDFEVTVVTDCCSAASAAVAAANVRDMARLGASCVTLNELVS